MDWKSFEDEPPTFTPDKYGGLKSPLVLGKIGPSEHLFHHTVYDIGVYTKDDKGEVSFDSQAASSDKNSYEMYREMSAPAFYILIQA